MPDLEDDDDIEDYCDICGEEFDEDGFCDCDDDFDDEEDEEDDD